MGVEGRPGGSRFLRRALSTALGTGRPLLPSLSRLLRPLLPVVGPRQGEGADGGRVGVATPRRRQGRRQTVVATLTGVGGKDTGSVRETSSHVPLVQGLNFVVYAETASSKGNLGFGHSSDVTSQGRRTHKQGK